MRVVQRTGNLTTLPGLTQKVGELCDASQEETEAISDAYTLTLPTSFTPVRTLDLTQTLTANDVGAVLATLLLDLKQRGVNRKKQANV